MRIDIHFHDDENEKLLNQILKNQIKIMATLQDIQDAVTQEDTVIDSAIAPKWWRRLLLIQVYLMGEPKRSKTMKMKVNFNQAAIDALAADIKAKSDSLAAAVTANTPAA